MLRCTSSAPTMYGLHPSSTMSAASTAETLSSTWTLTVKVVCARDEEIALRMRSADSGRLTHAENEVGVPGGRADDDETASTTPVRIAVPSVPQPRKARLVFDLLIGIILSLLL